MARQVWRNLRRSRSALIGLALVSVHVVAALGAPVIAPHSPTENNPAVAIQGPSWQYLLGTDQFGRDVLSRTLYGGRIALVASLLATSVAVGLGALIGLFIAYAPRSADDVGMRVVDAALAIPPILALLVTITTFGAGLPVIVLGIIAVYTPGVIRVVRAAALEVVPRDFVLAARARGERSASVVLSEIRPNTLDVVLVEFAMRASWVVLLVSALSFLGFGVNPPTPDWGLMIAENRTLISVAPWASFAPVVALSTLVVGLNLLADGFAKAAGLDLVRGAER
jgi:peptide/nickel transport system permease protein